LASADGKGVECAARLPGSLATVPLSELQLLSNGNYHVMVTNTGGGYSRSKTLALTRWHKIYAESFRRPEQLRQILKEAQVTVEAIIRQP
jgi:hypothetical protein